ncbi:unnamed protein product [Orchesella dallaii]|uniref:RRM domain-containing protein n=1 Tax=Orchesella dallaii TaxID=48710 RepID=A0ABP1R7N8_9HEXA
MASRMAQLGVGGEKDAIFVTNLPNLLAPDLKQLLIAHFDMFGTILRVSCVTKGAGKLAHIQFSSSEAAANAQRNGRVLRGCSLIIDLTDKHPKTQILPVRPTPVPIRTPTFPAVSTSSSHTQRTLHTYFQETSGSSRPSPLSGAKESKPIVHMRDEVASISNSGSSSEECSTPIRRHSNFAPQQQERSNYQQQDKPNPCLKIEVYKEPTSQRQEAYSPRINSFSTELIQTPATTVERQSHCAPTRSLSQILNFDTTRMKSIPTITPAHAVVCQFFNQNGPKFPLGQMWGRSTANVVMPLNIILDEIKPGMTINDNAVECAWKKLMFGEIEGVFKTELNRLADKVLSQEKILAQCISPIYDKLEEDALNYAVSFLADQEVDAENDHLVCIEDLMAEMIGDVCRKQKSEEEIMEMSNKAVDEIIGSFINELVKERCNTIFNVCTHIAEAAMRSCAEIEHHVVHLMVKEEASQEFLALLYLEVLDDLLESTYFDGCVRVAVSDFLKINEVQNESSSLIPENRSRELELDAADDTVEKEARSEPLVELCSEEFLTDLLNSYYFKVCVEVAVGNFMSTNGLKRNAVESAAAAAAHSTTQQDTRTDENSQLMSSVNLLPTGLLGSLKRKAVQYLSWSWPFKKQKKS